MDPNLEPPRSSQPPLTRAGVDWDGAWKTRWPWGPVRRLRLERRGVLPFVTGKYEVDLGGGTIRTGDFSLFDATSQPVVELAGLGLFAVLDLEVDARGRPLHFGLQRWSPSHGPHGRTSRLWG